MNKNDSERQYRRRASEQRRKSYQYLADDETAEPRETPFLSRELRYTLIFGVVAGLLSIILNIAITFSNLSTFQQALRQGEHISYNVALAVTGLQCLNFFVTLLVCLIAGYLVGRFVIQRRLGFYAGILAGIIFYLSSFVVNYIPNYPAKFTPNFVIELVFLVVWGLIGGLMGVLGAWLATRRHPNYVRSS